MKRYALLDTDFISKTHSVQDDGGNHLIDRVMELPEYEFFCHAQIVTELNRYNADAPIWLSEKIGAQKIKSYTDQEILESLSLVRGPLACATYTQMLKLACDAFSKDYFSEHYRALEEADYTVISREDYLKELERLDIEVGKKNNLGEIKSFVLLQVLSVMLGEQIYVFCSDDKNARNGATNFEGVRCISLVSVFSRLKEESNWTLADAEPYIESLIAFYQDHHQRVIAVFLYIGNRPGHLLQVGNFYFLRISAALLGFYTGLQVNNKAQIGLDEQDGHRIVYCPMRIILLCGPCIFCKKTEKPVSVIIGTECAGRNILLTVGGQIAESSTMVFY